MHHSIQRLTAIKLKIKENLEEKQLNNSKPEIIAVSKTFSSREITPLIEAGHIHFGENKIQEAESKWPEIKTKFKNIKLHMIGKLQSNKAKKAVKLFDYIHSLDSIKLAAKIFKYETELEKKTKIFIQVNIGEEKQKSGISILALNDLYTYCTQRLSLNIIGLMCLPENNSDSNKHFKILQDLSKQLGLKDLSMGMSNDYISAINYGATYVRLGTSIFGDRKS